MRAGERSPHAVLFAAVSALIRSCRDSSVEVFFVGGYQTVYA